MSSRAKYIFELLPAYHRIRDFKDGEPLKALIEVLAKELDVVEADIAQLYENWFIETCDEWVVPYIGDLLGVRGVHSILGTSALSQRAYVANTFGYRRRKGTAPILEQLALDTTGWRCRVVEFFELLGATQNVNHIRNHSLITPDLRRMNELDLLNTAFETTAHSVDVRRIAPGLGKYNIPNIGLFLWRLQSYPMSDSDARKVSCPLPDGGCYTFSPLGLSSQLFNLPQSETEITHLAEEINVPGMLRPRALHDELEARRMALLVDETTPEYVFFDDREDSGSPPVFEIFVNDSTEPIPPIETVICNLEEWRPCVTERKYTRVIDGTPEEIVQPIKVAVDPVLGRMSFANPGEVDNVKVRYAYGFSGDVGGGPYDRNGSVADVLSRAVTWQVGVSKEKTPVHDETIYDNLTEAVDAWNDQPEGTVGVIAIMDNRTYEEMVTDTARIEIPNGSQLLIVAADWPVRDVSGVPKRIVGDFKADLLRPHLLGDLEVKGTAAPDSITAGELILNGLLVEGKLTVTYGYLGSLQISHSTVVPGHGGLKINSPNDRLNISLKRSICGQVDINSASSGFMVEECIVDNQGGTAISSDRTPVELQKSTIFGEVKTIELQAGNCIFEDRLLVERRQTGCVRFSYVPDKSKTPRRFRCQPDLEISTQINKAEEDKVLSNSERQAIRKRILEWLIPIFTSSQYGHHAYGQLGRTCSCLIRTGAEDGSEMGVFNYLKQPQREVNLRTALDEYLRLGLEAGVIYVN